ncbi:MAG: spore coat protein [Halanaerobiaceae bacterium]
MNNQVNNQNNQISLQSMATDCLNSLKFLIIRDSFTAMESATPQVRQIVKNMTEEHLQMADEWFRLMANRGWYKVPQANSNLADQMRNHIQNLTQQQSQPQQGQGQTAQTQNQQQSQQRQQRQQGQQQQTYSRY